MLRVPKHPEGLVLSPSFTVHSSSVTVHSHDTAVHGERRLRAVLCSSAGVRGYGYDNTHPPAPPLNALLHSVCTGNVPVLSVIFADAPWPDEIHAHLSPFSAPLLSSQPPFGN